MRIERRAKCERLASSLTTGLKPLPRFRLKAGLWRRGLWECGDRRRLRGEPIPRVRAIGAAGGDDDGGQ